MNKISASKKKNKTIALLLRDGCNCAYCGIKFEKVEEITLDHVYPKSLGGPNANKNILLSCSTCNGNKGNMLLTQFIRAYEIKITRILARFL